MTDSLREFEESKRVAARIRELERLASLAQRGGVSFEETRLAFDRFSRAARIVLREQYEYEAARLAARFGVWRYLSPSWWALQRRLRSIHESEVRAARTPATSSKVGTPT